MANFHGRKIAVIEVLDEELTTADAEALATDTIGADAKVAAIDVDKADNRPMTRIFVEHADFKMLRYGDPVPLELRMRRKFRQDVQRG